MPKPSRAGVGPGLVITAAFIGPGTVTTCTLAGGQFGYSLLWVVIFSCLATYTLQEMSGRLGLIAGVDLGAAFRSELRSPWLRTAGIAMVVSAIGAGNAAYQTGNFLGASLGLSALAGNDVQFWPPILGLAAAGLLWHGSYKLLEWALIGLVGLMSVCFIVTAFLIPTPLLQLLEGMFVPRLAGGSLYLAMGLVGTTIVPYDLFLYSAIVRERWSRESDLGAIRLDLFVAILVGGAISMAIVITAAAAFFSQDTEIAGAGDLAMQLRPLLGNWAGIAMSVGLFGAGMSSAITAPLAAGYAVAGVLGWEGGLKDRRFRTTWAVVLGFGVMFASIGFQPIQAIIFAQVANGFLLPFVAVFLLWIANSRRLLGGGVNSWRANLAGGLVILITVVLGARGILRVLELLGR